MNRGVDVRQRTICLDNNAVLLRKLEKLSVFRVVIGVEVYLRVNIMKKGERVAPLIPQKASRWTNLIHCGNDFGSLEELPELLNVKVGYSNAPVSSRHYQKMSMQRGQFERQTLRDLLLARPPSPARPC